MRALVLRWLIRRRNPWWAVRFLARWPNRGWVAFDEAGSLTHFAEHTSVTKTLTTDLPDEIPGLHRTWFGYAADQWEQRRDSDDEDGAS